MARNAYIALITVQVVFGLLPAAGKTLFTHMDPLAMTSIRIIGAAFVLLWIHAIRGAPWPQARQWPGIAILATFGLIVNMGLFAMGLERTHPLNATLLITTIPVFTYIIAVVTGRETIGPRRLAGILLALSGAVYLVGLSGYEASLDSALGDIMVLLNALSFSYFLVISKRWSQENDVLALSTWMFVVAAAVFIPVLVLRGAIFQLADGGLSGVGWMGFVIVGPTLMAYVLNATALRHVPSSTVAVFIYLQPPVSAIASWFVLGLLPSWKIVPAAALILAGVTIVARRRVVAVVPAA